jgi:hypothetical protein
MICNVPELQGKLLKHTITKYWRIGISVYVAVIVENRFMSVIPACI